MAPSSVVVVGATVFSDLLLRGGTGVETTGSGIVSLATGAAAEEDDETDSEAGGAAEVELFLAIFIVKEMKREEDTVFEKEVESWCDIFVICSLKMPLLQDKKRGNRRRKERGTDPRKTRTKEGKKKGVAQEGPRWSRGDSSSMVLKNEERRREEKRRKGETEDLETFETFGLRLYGLEK